MKNKVTMPKLILLVISLFLISCESDFESFQNEIKSSVGVSAINCGVVEKDDDPQGAKTGECIEKSFNENNHFYSFYKETENNQKIAFSIFISKDGLLNFWKLYIDGENSGEIDKEICYNPELKGPTYLYYEIFTCH